jgi:hypothetical protein
LLAWRLTLALLAVLLPAGLLTILTLLTVLLAILTAALTVLLLALRAVLTLLVPLLLCAARALAVRASRITLITAIAQAALPHPLRQRFLTPDEITRAVERSAPGLTISLALRRTGRFVHLLTNGLDAFSDRVLELLRVVLVAATLRQGLRQSLRRLYAIRETILAHRLHGLVHLPRRFGMISLRITTHPVELRLELPNVALELLLLLDQPLGFGAIDAAARGVFAELVHVVRDAALVIRDLLRLANCVIEVARRATVSLLVEKTPSFLQTLQRRGTLCHAVVVRTGGRPSHGVRRFLQPARAFGDLVVVRIVGILAR